MKSPMITNARWISDKDNYSELRVMHSNAGFYVGTVYHNPHGHDEPGSRDSDYFKTREQAEHELTLILAGGGDEGAPMKQNSAAFRNLHRLA